MAELLIEHNNQGKTCVISANGMISVEWFEQEPIVDDINELWTKPVTILPAEKLFTFIDHLLKELHDGNWESVVKWLTTRAIWNKSGDIIY